MENREALDAFLETVESNGVAALATVVENLGARTVRVGAKVAVFKDGRTLGRLGDEALEKLAISESLEAIRHGKCRTVRVSGQSGGDVVTLFIEAAVSPPLLVVAGAGHIAQPVARIGKMLGFEIVVLDDRPEFANGERFPEADRIVVGDFAETLRGFPIDGRTYIVIITRGHRHDEECLREVARSGAAYVGMIGSKRKVGMILDHLRKIGIPGEAIERVHAPIGLNIGAETPEEIAISIMAEIVQVKSRRGSGEAMKSKVCMA